MKLSTLFIAALLGETSYAYKLGDKATGETDPDVTENCSRWANEIASGDTCKKLESDFDIDYLQLHEWVSWQLPLTPLRIANKNLHRIPPWLWIPVIQLKDGAIVSAVQARQTA